MKSQIWKYFVKKNDSAICNKCSKVLKCNGGSTSSLKNHLFKIHGTDVTKLSK